MDDALPFICIGVLLTGVFSLCNKDYIDKEEWEYSQHLCIESNTTLKEVGAAGKQYRAICKNGAEFYFDSFDITSWSKTNENKN